jgi:hypothetical protein
MPLQTVYSQNEGFVYREIAGEAILVPVYGQVADMESIFTLNEVGARMWSLFDGQRTVAEVCSAVLEEYDATPAEVEADIQELVETLVGIEALQPV